MGNSYFCPAYLPFCQFTKLDPILLAAAKALVKEQNKILVEKGGSLEVCSPDQRDCVPFMDWIKSVIALYSRKYGLRLYVNIHCPLQLHPNACWAATVVSVRNLRKGENHRSELSYFTGIAQSALPKDQVMRTYLSSQVNLAEYVQDRGRILAMPTTDAFSAWMQYFAEVPESLMARLFSFLYYTNGPRSEEVTFRETSKLMAYLRLAHWKSLDLQGRVTSWPRNRKHEKSLYDAVGFAYEQIPFGDFHESKLTALLENGPLIVALEANTMFLKGSDLTTHLQYLENQLAPEFYGSHYVIVLDFDPGSREVTLVSTLYSKPVKQGSLDRDYFSKDDKEPNAEPDIAVMEFSEFRRALMSDVRCVARNRDSLVSAQEAGQIPVAYLR